MKPKSGNHFKEPPCHQKCKSGTSDEVKSLHRPHKANCRHIRSWSIMFSRRWIKAHLGYEDLFFKKWSRANSKEPFLIIYFLECWDLYCHSLRPSSWLSQKKKVFFFTCFKCKYIKIYICLQSSNYIQTFWAIFSSKFLFWCFGDMAVRLSATSVWFVYFIAWIHQCFSTKRFSPNKMDSFITFTFLLYCLSGASAG